MIKIGNLNIENFKLGNTQVEKIFLGTTQVWALPSVGNYLTFTAEQANSTITYTPSSVTTAKYSTDGNTWYSFDNQTVTLSNIGDKVYVKGTISGVQEKAPYASFSMTGKIAASGSVMSLQNEDPDETTITRDFSFYNLFYRCTALTTPPELPATTLTLYCYGNMFLGCTSLTSAPTLPATTLGIGCYNSMFAECSALTSAPALPATTLVNMCYYNMFADCTALTTAPTLSAEEMAESCYKYMFSGCSSLTAAPELNSTSLATSCYEGMFYNCSGLTSAPELPATTLANRCYFQMFRGCSSLSTAPILPAGEMTEYCYVQMFTNCPLINFVSTEIVDWTAENASNWLYGAAQTGQIQCLEECDIPENSDSGIPTGWTRYVEIPNYLKFTAVEPDSTVTYTPTSVTTAQYSTDGINWTALDYETISLPNIGDNIYVKGVISGNQSGSEYAQFSMTGKIDASGSIMSLYNEDPEDIEISYNGAFKNLFNSCDSLTTAPELPATTISLNCYDEMFQNCTSLTTTPELPANTLTSSCYYQMFKGCTSLITPPELPAASLGNYCYYQMFYGCTSLTSAPELPATTLNNGCYQAMFEGCTSLTIAPELPATTLARYCYSTMFRYCPINIAPELPATTLFEYCYNGMFQNCSNLTTAPELPATTLANGCYNSLFWGCSVLNYVKHNVTNWNTGYATDWLRTVAATGTVECPIDSTIPVNNNSGVPTGWERVNF